MPVCSVCSVSSLITSYLVSFHPIYQIKPSSTSTPIEFHLYSVGSGSLVSSKLPVYLPCFSSRSGMGWYVWILSIQPVIQLKLFSIVICLGKHISMIPSQVLILKDSSDRFSRLQCRWSWGVRSMIWWWDLMISIDSLLNSLGLWSPRSPPGSISSPLPFLHPRFIGLLDLWVSPPSQVWLIGS